MLKVVSNSKLSSRWLLPLKARQCNWSACWWHQGTALCMAIAAQLPVSRSGSQLDSWLSITNCTRLCKGSPQDNLCCVFLLFPPPPAIRGLCYLVIGYAFLNKWSSGFLKPWDSVCIVVSWVIGFWVLRNSFFKLLFSCSKNSFVLVLTLEWYFLLCLPAVAQGYTPTHAQVVLRWLLKWQWKRNTTCISLWSAGFLILLEACWFHYSCRQMDCDQFTSLTHSTDDARVSFLSCRLHNRGVHTSSCAISRWNRLPFALLPHLLIMYCLPCSRYHINRYSVLTFVDSSIGRIEEIKEFPSPLSLCVDLNTCTFLLGQSCFRNLSISGCTFNFGSEETIFSCVEFVNKPFPKKHVFSTVVCLKCSRHSLLMFDVYSTAFWNALRTAEDRKRELCFQTPTLQLGFWGRALSSQSDAWGLEGRSETQPSLLLSSLGSMVTHVQFHCVWLLLCVLKAVVGQLFLVWILVDTWVVLVTADTWAS